MFSISKSQARWVLLGLAGLMAVTRFHYFGSSVSLPDASLAVFSLAGLYLRPSWSFPVFLIEAGLIDYLAITYGGVSNWCVSPAYVFLVPTYAVMWGAGRWCARFERLGLSTALSLSAVLWLATTLAFLVSNGSFYLFSGWFPDINWAEYAQRVAHYYLPYLTFTLIYAGLVLSLPALFRLLAERLSRRPPISSCPG